MIRRSTAIATVAILLSLLVHFAGLSVNPRGKEERQPEAASTDVVAMGNAFEDVAEPMSEPALPEPAPVPEPPETPAPEPERAEVPTNEVLVASANPQRTFAPDTGSTKVLQRDTAGQSEPQEGDAPEPENPEPSGGDQGTSAQASATPPVEPDTVTETPKGDPDAITKSVTGDTADPVSPAALVPQQHATLPVQVAPTLSIAPNPELSTVPVVPLESETVDPEPSEATVEPVPDQLADETDGADQAVVSSLRPPVRPQGLQDGSQDLNHLRLPSSQPMESPLIVYQRDGVDLTLRRNSGSQSGGRGFADSRGHGNSDVTNYAGRVLVHLNRSQVVFVPSRGSARIFFEINPDGSLAWVDVIDSTGSREVDRAAKEQVRSAAPFPRPPDGTSRKLSFVYRIN